MRKYVCLKVTGFQILLAMILAIGFTCIAQAQLIESASSSATAVQVAQPFEDGALIFVDRTHIYAFSEDRDPSLDADSRAFLESLVGSEYVMTSNSDKTVPNLQVTVTLAKAATIYLVLDNRLGGAPGGLGVDPILPVQMQWVTDMGFVDTGYDVGIDESGDGSINQYSSIFTADFPAGDVILGTQNDGGGRNNYSIIVAAAVKATNPSPANGATLVPLSPTLSWDAPSGVDNPTYDVYFGTDANTIQNPKIAAGISETSKDITGLSYETTYYWRVDVLEPNDAGPNPIVHTGPTWQFITTTQKPVITKNPQNQAGDPGSTVVFSMDVEKDAGVTFQWFKKDPNTLVETALSDSDPDISGTTSKSLTIANIEPADEAFVYFCRATNSAGASDTTAATLTVKRIVGWWNFDGNVIDQSENNNDGTLHGSPTYVADHIVDDGQAIDLSGSADDFVDLGPAPELNFGTGDWTIAAWIKAGSLQSTNIYSKGGDGTDGIRILLQVGEDNGSTRPTLTTDDNITKVYTHGATVVTDNQWHYVVGVRHGDEALIYVDGTLDATAMLPAGYDLSGQSQQNAYIGIGVDQPTGTFNNKHFNGLVDDVIIYNYALSEMEVATKYTDITGNTVCLAPIMYDLNNDCVINLQDLAIFADSWLDCNLVPQCIK